MTGGRDGADGAVVRSGRLPRLLECLAFTAVFAVVAGFVFWGTWSMDVAPVMPDHPIAHAADHLSGFVNAWLTSGKFVPGDAIAFLGSPYFWQELKYALALYCAALGLAYFCRGRGLPSVACYGAGLLLAFCGYWMTLFSAGHYGWFQWMTYGVFAFGLIDRAISRGRLHHWLLLGACLAWGSFYQPDLWLLFTVFTAAYFVYRSVRERKFDRKGVALAAVAFFAIGAPSFRAALFSDLKGRDQQIAEGQTVANDGKTDDAEKRWIFATNWSLPPDEIKEFFVPRLNGDTSCPFTLSIGLQRGNGIKPYEGALGRPKDAPRGNCRQHSLYVGWVTCLFALCGLASAFIRRDRRGDVAFFAVAAVVFCLFSFGRYCEPVYRMVFALPFGDYLRAPVKWHHLTEFCLVVLAAYGIGWLASLKVKVAGREVVRYALPALILLGVVDLARNDRRFCAPVDVAEARRTNSSVNLTILQRPQFQNPQVAEMVRQKRIISLANYLGNPDLFVVEVLQPFGKTKPVEASTLAVVLGVVSLLATLGVLSYSTLAVCRKPTART